MPHADSSLVPESVKSKAEFWRHVYEQLELLLSSERNWVSNLANTSSVVYNSLLAFPAYFGTEERAVNWCGFYLDSTLFPIARLLKDRSPRDLSSGDSKMLLGPFCGKPACQFINTSPGRARGVCAGAFLDCETKLVVDVDAYPGHIACDGDTKSEIVCPLIVKHEDLAGGQLTIGVMDLDCLVIGGFDEEDKIGLERISELVVRSCDW